MKKIIVLFVSVFLLSSCSEILNLIRTMDIKEPVVSVAGSKITALSFEKIDMQFDVNIQNQNAVGIKFDGFDYDLKIDGSGFLSGNQSEGVEILAGGSKNVSIPVSIKFDKLFDLASNFLNKDSMVYDLNVGVLFNLPVLGNKRIAVSKRGDIPVLKLPGLSIKSIELKNLGLTGAELALKVNLSNANSFNLNVDQFEYNLQINGRNWLSGINSDHFSIDDKTDKILSIPVKLNFLEIGNSVMDLLQGNTQLDYDFSGNIDFGKSIDLLEKFNLPFNKNGKISLTK